MERACREAAWASASLISSAIVAALTRWSLGRSCSVFTFQRSWPHALLASVRAEALGPSVKTVPPMMSAMPAAATAVPFTPAAASHSTTAGSNRSSACAVSCERDVVADLKPFEFTRTNDATSCDRPNVWSNPKNHDHALKRPVADASSKRACRGAAERAPTETGRRQRSKPTMQGSCCGESASCQARAAPCSGNGRAQA